MMKPCHALPEASAITKTASGERGLYLTAVHIFSLRTRHSTNTFLLKITVAVWIQTAYATMSCVTYTFAFPYLALVYNCIFRHVSQPHL